MLVLHVIHAACAYPMVVHAIQQGGVVRSWFDDRVEARSALSKLAYLNQLTKLNRKTLPWGKALEEMDSLVDPPEVEEPGGVASMVDVLGGGAGARSTTGEERSPTPV
jgi:hypothetical protein